MLYMRWSLSEVWRKEKLETVQNQTGKSWPRGSFWCFTGLLTGRGATTYCFPATALGSRSNLSGCGGQWFTSETVGIQHHLFASEDRRRHFWGPEPTQEQLFSCGGLDSFRDFCRGSRLGPRGVWRGLSKGVLEATTVRAFGPEIIECPGLFFSRYTSGRVVCDEMGDRENQAHFTSSSFHTWLRSNNKHPQSALSQHQLVQPETWTSLPFDVQILQGFYICVNPDGYLVHAGFLHEAGRNGEVLAIKSYSSGLYIWKVTWNDQCKSVQAFRHLLT